MPAIDLQVKSDETLKHFVTVNEDFAKIKEKEIQRAQVANRKVQDEIDRIKKRTVTKAEMIALDNPIELEPYLKPQSAMQFIEVRNSVQTEMKLVKNVIKRQEIYQSEENRLDQLKQKQKQHEKSHQAQENEKIAEIVAIKTLKRKKQNEQLHQLLQQKESDEKFRLKTLMEKQQQNLSRLNELTEKRDQKIQSQQLSRSQRLEQVLEKKENLYQSTVQTKLQKLTSSGVFQEPVKKQTELQQSPIDEQCALKQRKKEELLEKQLQEKIKLLERQKTHQKIRDIKMKDIEEEEQIKKVKKVQKLKQVKQNFVQLENTSSLKNQEFMKLQTEKMQKTIQNVNNYQTQTFGVGAIRQNAKNEFNQMRKQQIEEVENLLKQKIQAEILLKEQQIQQFIIDKAMKENTNKEFQIQITGVEDVKQKQKFIQQFENGELMGNGFEKKKEFQVDEAAQQKVENLFKRVYM